MGGKEGSDMNRERFEHLLSAYGADFRRWPHEERENAVAFATRGGEEVAAALAEARALDEALDAAADTPADLALLEARILRQAPRKPSGGQFDRRALLALAACAVFGVLLGYGGGRLAPEQTVENEDYFAMAFESPFEAGEGG